MACPAAAAEGEAPTEANSGANAYVYFVCNQLGGPLTQLPSVTPPQIKTSRHVKKLLTGRLSSQVSSYPMFPGTEANYLRALVGGPSWHHGPRGIVEATSCMFVWVDDVVGALGCVGCVGHSFQRMHGRRLSTVLTPVPACLPADCPHQCHHRVLPHRHV